MTAFGKLFVVIVAVVFVFIVLIGIAYIVYLQQGSQMVASTLVPLLNI